MFLRSVKLLTVFVRKSLVFVCCMSSRALTLNACSRCPAVNKYLYMETKEKYFMHTQKRRTTHEYTSLENPSTETSSPHMKTPRSIIHEKTDGDYNV